MISHAMIVDDDKSHNITLNIKRLKRVHIHSLTHIFQLHLK